MFVTMLRARIADLTAAGRTTAEVAAELDIACNTVRYHLGRLREDPATGTSCQPDLPAVIVSQVQTRACVERLLAGGLSRAEVARELGVAKSTVSYHARRLGRPVDERGARRYD